MIMRKTWSKERFKRDGVNSPRYQHTDQYIGWFLFGVIPLFISRERLRYVSQP